MFERYPAEAVRMLFLARSNAARAGARTVEAEHLLAAALAAREAAPSDGEPQLRGPQSQIPLGEHVQWLLNRAAMTADTLGHHRIRPEHVLIALTDDERGSTVVAVRAAGIDRSQLLRTAERQAAIDDSPLPYHVRVPGVANPRTENQ